MLHRCQAGATMASWRRCAHQRRSSPTLGLRQTPGPREGQELVASANANQMPATQPLLLTC